MNREDKRIFRDIIRAKAEYLVYTGTDIGERAEEIRDLRVRASGIPDRKKADRDRKKALQERAADIEIALVYSLGWAALRTLAYVREHKHLLIEKRRKELKL